MEFKREFFGKTISEKCIKRSQKHVDFFKKKIAQKDEKRYYFQTAENENGNFVYGITELVLSEKVSKINSKRAVFIIYSGLDTTSARNGQITAEAFAAQGYKVYVFDATRDKNSSAGKLIIYYEKLKRKNKVVLENLPTLGKIFVKSEFRSAMKIEKSYLNSEIAKVMSDVFINVPAEIPVIACDAMLATACREAGVAKVYNLIDDTEIFGENLSEKAINIVQVLSSYLKYRIIEKGVKIPEESIIDTGYLIDNSSFENIESDCNKRFERIKTKERKRVFVDFENIENSHIEKVCESLLKNVNFGESKLYINFGSKNGIRRKIMKKYSEHTLNIGLDNKVISYSEIEDKNPEDKRILCFGENNKFLNSFIVNEIMRNSDFAICGLGPLVSAPVPKIVLANNKTSTRIENKEINICAVNFEELKDIVNLITTEENILKTMIKNVIKCKKTGMYNGIINLTGKIFE